MRLSATARLAAAVLPAVLACAPLPALAQSVPPVYVSAAGEDNDSNSQCRLYHGTMVGAVENALRNQGISIGSQDDYSRTGLWPCTCPSRPCAARPAAAS